MNDVCAVSSSDRQFHVAVSGGRTRPTQAQQSFTLGVLAWFRQIGIKFVHHGDCVGYDEFCHEAMMWNPATQLAPVIHPPVAALHRSYRSLAPFHSAAGGFVHEPEDYLVRNDAMIAASCFLLAAPSSERRPRSGTWYTIDAAVEEGLPHMIVMPGGGVACVPGAHPSAHLFDKHPMPLTRLARGSS